jgi:hypothetical protein
VIYAVGMTMKLVLISLALIGASGAAQAGCPRGQIYQVSKHACISRDDAVKLGIVRAAKPRPEAAPEAQAPEAPQTQAPEAQAAEPEQRAPSEVGTALHPRHVHAVKVKPAAAPEAPQDPYAAPMPAFAPIAAPTPPVGSEASAAETKAPAAEAKAPAAEAKAAPGASPFGALDTANVPAMASPLK